MVVIGKKFKAQPMEFAAAITLNRGHSLRFRPIRHN